jgi:hypothetical protein
LLSDSIQSVSTGVFNPGRGGAPRMQRRPLVRETHHKVILAIVFRSTDLTLSARTHYPTVGRATLGRGEAPAGSTLA